MKPNIHIAEDAASLARLAAAEFARLALAAVQERGIFTVALSGGSTPKRLYTELAIDDSLRPRLPWDKMHFFWGDERHVPPDHEDSNYRMVHEALLSRVPVPDLNVHRLRGEEPDAAKAAREYEQELQEFFQLSPGKFPRLDLVLLGLGPDGHTASLFPKTAALNDREHLVVANWVESFQTHRLTLTLPVLNNAANVVFLVSGIEKAQILRAVLADVPDLIEYPAQLVRPVAGDLWWLVDRGAGSLLTTTA
jgi:6-phosphogluconolactonase